MNKFDKWSKEWCQGLLHDGDDSSKVAYLAAKAAWDAAIDASAQLAEERNDNADCLYSVGRILGNLAGEIEEMKND